MKVQVYTTEKCHYCKKLKAYLKEHNIEFEEHNVSDNIDKREEMIAKSKGFAVPVIDIDGIILVGFNMSEINKVLKINGQ